MAAIITKDTRVHNAKQFIEAVSEAANTTIYTFLGKPSSWAVEAAPDTPADNYRYQVDAWDNMTALKRVRPGDVTIAVKRNNWQTGTVYSQYTDLMDSSNLFDSNFAVLNSEYNVYKCLSNNFGVASTVEPLGTGSVSNNLIIHSQISQDGYIWKYMYSITVGEWAKFGTTSFVPAKINSTVQTNAANTKGIYAFSIVNTATPLSNDDYITIVGDGQGANAQILVSGGVITGVRINNYGNNYNVASVTTVGANLIPIIAPLKGHGYDAFDELGGVYSMVNTRLEQSDAIPVDGFKFRQVGLVKDPTLFGTTQIPSETSANIILYAYGNLKCTATTLTNPGFITAGNTLTGATTGANATIVSYTGNVINIIRTRTTSANLLANYRPFQAGEQVTIAGNPIGTLLASGFYGNATIQPKSGEVIYIDNRNVIARASDQVEDIHIVLEF
jgi:hypothetical protein